MTRPIHPTDPNSVDQKSCPHSKSNDPNATHDVYKRSLWYHEHPTPGKIAMVPTKALDDQDDLALAYSPGVAQPCREIEKHGAVAAARYTGRGNLVAVISNGTAVLGLGDIGAMASKPVMEGKAVLFKKFAHINCIDLEIDEKDPQKLVDIIASLEPTFGGVNLEDIKAPECFYIEQELKKRMKIPVFHDDQHGTAIVVGAAVINALFLANKKIEDVKLVTSGAGAGAIACLGLLIELGVRRENITLCDRKGVVYVGRDASMEPTKEAFAQDTPHRSLSDAIKGADIFLGLSCANVVTPSMIASMAPNPVVLALANPEPEIHPDLVHATRADAIVATGRSDYPNQVNNVLCFPYIFRGALDVGATQINTAMKVAAVHAIAALGRLGSSPNGSLSHHHEAPQGFGPKRLIPNPFDRRLFVEVTLAVAKAAVESGVATNHIRHWDAYRHDLMAHIDNDVSIMHGVWERAKKYTAQGPIRVAFSHGQGFHCLQSLQMLGEHHIAKGWLIGHPPLITQHLNDINARLIDGVDYTLAPCDGEKSVEFLGLSLLQTHEVDALIISAPDDPCFEAVVQNALSSIAGEVSSKNGSILRTVMAPGALGQEHYFFILSPLHSDEHRPDLSTMIGNGIDHLKLFELHPTIYLQDHEHVKTKVQTTVSTDSPPKKGEGSFHFASVEEMEHLFSFDVEGMKTMVDSDLDDLTPKAHLIIMENDQIARLCHDLLTHLSGSRIMAPMVLGLGMSIGIVGSNAKPRDVASMVCLLTCEKKGR